MNTDKVQAGAVAAWVDKRDLVNLLDGKADRATVHRERFDGDDRPLFATPPAAVPVEALEGLVRAWRNSRVPGLHSAADRLNRLILIERSKELIKGTKP